MNDEGQYNEIRMTNQWYCTKLLKYVSFCQAVSILQDMEFHVSSVPIIIATRLKKNGSK